MTAQNSANKSVFYKFLPYYLNKVKYLRPQLIMSIIFSVLSYPAFMLIINILCPVERELLELSQYISDPTPEQYEMNMALLDKRSLLYSLLIAEIIIGVLSLVGLFIFTFVTTLRSFRCLHNKSVVDMDMSLPINHNTRFFGDLAAVFTVNILPHLIAILLAQILLQFADLSAFDTQGETQAIVEAIMGPMAFTGLFMCIMEIAITLLLISFCGRLAEACIYPILINFAIPVIHLMTINLRRCALPLGDIHRCGFGVSDNRFLSAWHDDHDALFDDVNWLQGQRQRLRADFPSGVRHSRPAGDPCVLRRGVLPDKIPPR